MPDASTRPCVHRTCRTGVDVLPPPASRKAYIQARRGLGWGGEDPVSLRMHACPEVLSPSSRRGSAGLPAPLGYSDP